jgi:hypothetical protein
VAAIPTQTITIRLAISQTHGCDSVHVGTVPVRETFQGRTTVWNGDVEVFSLINHPKAKRLYAWAHLDGPKDDKKRFVAVLELPPVKDAKTAVQASIMADLKEGQS